MTLEDSVNTFVDTSVWYTFCKSVFYSLNNTSADVEVAVWSYIRVNPQFAFMDTMRSAVYDKALETL
jgi:hypothetical protein